MEGSKDSTFMNGITDFKNTSLTVKANKDRLVDFTQCQQFESFYKEINLSIM